MAVTSAIPVVWSEATLAHRPDREVWIGMPLESSEVPARVAVIEQALRFAGHEFVEAAAHPDEALSTVHTPALVRHLSTVYAAWVAGGFVDYGQDRVVPYFFPTAAMLGPLPVNYAARRPRLQPEQPPCRHRRRYRLPRAHLL